MALFASSNIVIFITLIWWNAWSLNNIDKERKAGEKSAAELAAIVKASTYAIISKQIDGTILSWNHGAETLFGYPAAEAIGKNIRMLFPPELKGEEEIILSKIKSGEPINHFETVRLRKDGTRIPVSITISPIMDPKGNIAAISKTAWDISEFKLAQKQIEESIENFQALVKASAQFVWGVNDKGRSVGMNDWWQDFTGQNLEELVEYEWLEALHPDDRDFAKSAWKTALENKSFFEVEYRIRNKKGEYYFFSVRGVPVFNKDGSFRQWMGTFTDITERKKTEADLRESERRLQLAISAAELGIWEWEVQTDNLFWSDKIYQIFDRKKPVKKAEDFFAFVIPEDKEMVQESAKRAFENTEGYELDFRIERPDNEIRWINCRAVPRFDKNGSPMRILGVIQDFTNRKKAQDELNQAEAKLRQAQKLESIGRLTGGIAHDFNNMLTVILGYCDLSLNRLPGDSPVRSFLEGIRSAGDRSASLTQQLLAFSRQQNLHPVILDLNQVISETTKLIRRLIGEDIQVILILNPETGQIEADPGHLTQVIMNLIVNSRDAMPNGGTITIETENRILDENYVSRNVDASPGEYVLIMVSDTGTGIPKEALENIFEPFFTTKEIGKGTGLGLATVYGIVRQSGGHIDVHSRVGRGTTFEIFLPRVRKEKTIDDENDVSENLLQGEETILIVEDEQIVRQLTKNFLESYGYTVIVAQNGEEALDIFRSEKNKIDLLLTDVVMPSMGGYELAEKLSEEFPGLKTLFMSGYTDDSRIKKADFEMSDNFIQKPFELKALGYKIREILSK